MSCLIGFEVKEGVCVKKNMTVICGSDSFKNTEGLCVKGDIENCAKYCSPYGQC